MNGLESYATVMLVGGIILFLAALVCLFLRFPTGLVVTLFILSIIMIGFERVKSFKIGDNGVELSELIKEHDNNPANPEIQDKLKQTLVRYNGKKPASVPAQEAEQVARANEILHQNNQALTWAEAAVKKDPNSTQGRELVQRLQLKQLTPATAGEAVSPQAAPQLTKAVTELKQQPNLSAESKVALSKAHLALGQEGAAADNLQSALKDKPKVVVDPRLRALITATPHQP